ncbi:hypothetical protein OIB37_12040 [Streptomyces sp. NBC_00820]|uniref:hypothetical protein n=1 Tax=Streptomyces sp. NBC_00820 TaxID=2975842 RepID=UPI002ED26EF3|nr:hypothetical protein OIB37_12040 [Streptomyces sp. NBC_00820]
MTQSDIALLLADAADEVEIGIAPVQAVMRAGRRRKARRWAVGAATALVLAGSTGVTLALAGLPGDGGAVTATRPASPEARHVYEPRVTLLARGADHGKAWTVDLQVWGAPRDEREADRQFDAMKSSGLEPADATKPAELIGKMSYFAIQSYGDGQSRTVMFNSVEKQERFAGTDLTDAAVSLEPGAGAKGSYQLVIGQVAKTAREVTCNWKDGSATVARPAGPTPTAQDGNSLIRPVPSYPAANWFVCVGPAGADSADVKVTK